MNPLELEVRYAREVADPDLPCREEHFRHGFATWQIPAEQAALVLVDCWASHQVASFAERAESIAREKILPVARACRAAGITVIHAPSQGWADNYPQSSRYAAQGEVAAAPAAESQPAAWPPPEFAGRQDAHQGFRVPRLLDEPAFQTWHLANPLQSLRVYDFLGPEPDDCVVGDSDQMQRLCRERGILHLFYAGFATNICVRFRDYGMHAMRERGYNVVLLRDCTTGIEFGETVDGMWLTRAAILDIEMKVGPSLTAEQLQQACARAL